MSIYLNICFVYRMVLKRVKSNAKQCLSYVWYFVTLLLLGILLFILLVPMKRETFTSTRSLYRTSDRFEEDLVINMMEDVEDPLHMQGCYQFDPTKDIVETYLPECYVKMFTRYTTSFEEIRASIVSELQNIVGKLGGKIKKDAYVLILQSPYLRDENGNVITAQFNISQYGFSPVHGGNPNSSTPLYFKVYIILPKYTKKLLPNQRDIILPVHLSRYRTKKDQCFIRCVGDNTGSYCGCMNVATIDQKKQESYISTCSSTKEPSGNANVSMNVSADFAVLYKINSNSPLIARSNVIA